MEVPSYLKVLWKYKWLVVASLVLSITIGFFAGYAIGPAGVTSRAIHSYSATSTLLLTSPQDILYRAEIPAQPLREGYSQPESVDLEESAVIYAFIISGSRLQEEVVREIGPLDVETESISAVRRTTQPEGNERFPGNLRLPVIDIVSTATDPERTREMTAVATAVFLNHVRAEQDVRSIADGERVEVRTLHVGEPEIAEESNPNVPVVFTAFAAMIAFLALIFALHAFRTKRSRQEASREADSAGSGTSPQVGQHSTDLLESARARSDQSGSTSEHPKRASTQDEPSASSTDPRLAGTGQ